MITTLTGENSFAVQHELDGLVVAFVREHGDLALERVDGEDAEPNRLNEVFTSLPFLADRKLVVLSRAGTNKAFTENVEPLLGDLPETTDVIIVEPKLDKRLAYYKYLKKATDFREFPAMDGPLLAKWLSDAAQQRGGTLSRADAQYLVERAGANQQLLTNELDKLLLYDAAITRETITRLVEATPQSTIFELLQAAFDGHAERALKLYDEQRVLGAEPPQIVAMLAWQLHVVALIKAAGRRSADEIAAQAKMSPFVIRKSQSIARHISVARLKQLVSDLLSIDVRSKSQSFDSDEALQNYLLMLAKT